MDEKKLITEEKSTERIVGSEQSLAEAQKYIDSGLLPDYIKEPATAVVIMQMGKELGLEPMTAFNNIYVVSGKPTQSGALMSALLKKGGVKWKTLKDNEAVTNEKGDIIDYETEIIFYRDDIEETVKYSYTEARDAGITGKDNWRKYRRNMLWWRCFSLGARRVGSDLINAMYLADELADATHGSKPIVMTEDGEIQEINN